VAAAVRAKAHKNPAGLARAAGLLARRAGLPVVTTGRPLPGLDGALRFTGPLPADDVRLLFAGAEALVVPSFVEGFGLPAAEALACGTPVVCGPGLGALPYLADVSVVDVAEPAEIAAAVERVLGDPGLRERVAAAGPGVAARLGVEPMARATADVYREALD
jgi:glycosyltransferase involved in cell wall biosynthesis